MVVVVAFAAMSTIVNAQDDVDPFADPAAPAPADPAAPETPLATPAPAAAPAINYDEAAAALANDSDVVALLETNPTTPSQLLRAVNVLIDLKKAPAARPLLTRLAAEPLDDAQLTTLAEEFGSGVLLRLARQVELQPMGGEFSARVTAAADRLARDPQRLSAAIAALSQPDRSQRRAAMRTLRAGGEAAAVLVIEGLADPAREAEHEALRTALVAIGEAALAPTLAAAESGNATLAAQGVEVVGRLLAAEPNMKVEPQDPLAVLLALAVDPATDPAVRRSAGTSLALLGVSPPAPAAVADQLADRARQLLRVVLSLQEPVTDVPLNVWRWDAEKPGLVEERVSARQEELDVAADLAARAFGIAPHDRTIRRLYLETKLTAAGNRVGFDQPLPAAAIDAVKELGVAALVDLLAHVPAEGDVSSATAAARLLGEIATADVLDPVGARPAPLVRALRHSDPRLRYAALDAVLKLAPSRRFMGDSFVPEALARFLATTGRPVALVADSRGDVGRSIAGMLNDMGYLALSSVDGRELFNLAADSTDCELILISATLYDNTAVDLLDQLRKDTRTARIPVAVYASSESMPRAERLVRRDPRAISIVRPRDVTALEFQLADLLARSRAELPGQQVRDRQAAGALGWLDRLTSEKGHVFDLTYVEPALHAALDNPALAASAMKVLSRYVTPSSQQGLVQMASRGGTTIELRQAAARAFCESIGRNGTRLTSAEILLQYDEYHGHEGGDAQVREVLGTILDCMEARVATAEPTAPHADRETPAPEPVAIP
ncbi:MAG: hypothetical protein KF708_19770 [Pirellulales bacterium]|nr:hypothetical protein [Pirellulales bacterium]